MRPRAMEWEGPHAAAWPEGQNLLLEGLRAVPAPHSDLSAHAGDPRPGAPWRGRSSQQSHVWCLETSVTTALLGP